MQCETRVIELPEQLCEAVERRFGTQFSSLEELTNIHGGIDSIQSILQSGTPSTNKGAFQQ